MIIKRPAPSSCNHDDMTIFSLLLNTVYTNRKRMSRDENQNSSGGNSLTSALAPVIFSFYRFYTVYIIRTIYMQKKKNKI